MLLVVLLAMREDVLQVTTNFHQDSLKECIAMNLWWMR